MTNTEAPAAPYVSEFEKVRLMVDIESIGFWGQTEVPAFDVIAEEGMVEPWGESGFWMLTPKGRQRLAGFRALLATVDE